MGFLFRVSQFCKNLGLNFLFLITVVPIFLLLGGQFWAMDRLNLQCGQINLLDGHLPTHLTCYLPPCYKDRLQNGFSNDRDVSQDSNFN